MGPGPAQESADGAESTLSLLQQRSADGTVLLVLSGGLDVGTAPQLAGALRELPGQRVEVDLHGVHLLGAAGLGVLATASARLRQSGGDLRLVRPRPLAARCLSITHLDGLLSEPGSSGGQVPEQRQVPDRPGEGEPPRA